MTEIYAITNQKGGVGKTTTCINLAASLAKFKQRVLLVDCDPQGNATMGSGVNKSNLETSLTEILLEQIEPAACLHTTEAGFDVWPGNSELTFAEVSLLQTNQKEFRLQQALQKITANYDFILLDCPPSLNTLTVNALVAANGVIVPMQCEYFALEGLTSLLATVQQIQADTNPQLKIVGILRTMYDKRSRLSLDVTQQLEKHFGDCLYDTVIPRNIRLAEAPSHGQPAIVYDPRSPGAVAYEQLALEILKKVNPQALSKENKTLAKIGKIIEKLF
jgi:chromosome partitioning protein